MVGVGGGLGTAELVGVGVRLGDRRTGRCPAQVVEQALRRAKEYGGPVLVHVITQKGFGYGPAVENEDDCLHQAPGAPLSRRCARRAHQGPGPRSSGTKSAAIGQRRPDVVAITAAMLHPTGLAAFARAFPDRVYDVGIAEQHAVTSAAGLAMGGLHPVVAIYATFLNRAFDQMLMDVALHKLPVTRSLDRAGVTGPDGATHNGMWDGSILQVVPGLRSRRPVTAARAADCSTRRSTRRRPPGGALPQGHVGARGRGGGENRPDGRAARYPARTQVRTRTRTRGPTCSCSAPARWR